MSINPHYAYLTLNVPFAIVWILVFLFSKETRKKQLTMSLMLIWLGTLTEIMYFQDYWHPESVLTFSAGSVRFLFEDFLFSFVIAGLASVAYDVIFKERPTKISSFSTILVPLIIVGLVSVLLFVLGVNSIFSTSAGYLAGAMFILKRRRDLTLNALAGGISITIIMVTCYLALLLFVNNSEELLTKIWYLYGTSLDIRLCGIPITEFVWFFSNGFFIGPIYEYMKK